HKMASRNRTALFKKYRIALRDVEKRSLSSSEPSTSGYGGSGSGPVIELSTAPFLQHGHKYTPLSTDDADKNRGDAVTIGLPPAWVDISEEIVTNMQRARSKIAVLAKTYAKALMPTFGDTTADQQAIKELTHEITHLLKRSEQMLQKLSGRGLSEDANVQKNVQRSLATDLQALSMEFRKQQQAYLQRLRQQKDGSDEVDIGMNLNDPKTRYEDDEFFDEAFSTQQLARIKKTEVLTAEREREIIQIVESVNQLQQIMKDLSTLVIDQCVSVDDNWVGQSEPKIHGQRQRPGDSTGLLSAAAHQQWKRRVSSLRPTGTPQEVATNASRVLQWAQGPVVQSLRAFQPLGQVGLDDVTSQSYVGNVDQWPNWPRVEYLDAITKVTGQLCLLGGDPCESIAGIGGPSLRSRQSAYQMPRELRRGLLHWRHKLARAQGEASGA
ncbi:hypothetical protein KI387_018511, partial [Taxus chinensis]